MLPDCSKFPIRNFQMFGYVFHDILGKPNSCGKLKILWYFLNEICYRIGNVCSFIENRICLCQYMRMTSRWRRNSRIWLPCGRIWWKMWILTKPHQFLVTYIWDALNVNANQWNDYWTEYEYVWVTYSCWSNRKLPGWWNFTHRRWRGDMEGMLKIVLNDIVNWQTRKWSNFTKVSASLFGWSSMDPQEELESVGELIVKKFARKLFGNASIWHELDDVTSCGQWTSLQRSVTNWIRACDKRLARLISYLLHTNDCRQCCHVGNTAQHCRLGLFQDSVFAGDVEDSKSMFRRCLAHFRKQNICYTIQKSISERILCIFGSQTFVPVSWMCKKQSSVSHSSTKSEVISLDAGLTYGWVICSWFLGFSNWTKHTSHQENWGSSWFPKEDPACHRKYFLQDKQFRISCRSRVICQFWKHFVFYFATTGIVGIGCTWSLETGLHQAHLQVQYSSEVTN